MTEGERTGEQRRTTNTEAGGFRPASELMAGVPIETFGDRAAEVETSITPVAVDARPPAPWRPPQIWSERWKTLVLDLVDPNRSATPADVAWFFYRCQRLGLDPLAEQAHFLWIRGRPKFYVGIHGARTLAEATHQRGTETPPALEKGADGKPAAAIVTVERVRGTGADRYVSVYAGRATLEEYLPRRDLKPGDPWLERREFMLGKCAAMIAYRTAFPEVLGDVYVREELEAAEDRR